MSPTCTTLVRMTVRLSVTLPDDVHADLLRVAGSSNISASAVIRALLSDVLPRLTGILDYIGAMSPSDVGPVVEDLDVWTVGLRALLHDAPPLLEGFRAVLDEPPPGRVEP